jgi:autotransporter-associated beta strand protein
LTVQNGSALGSAAGGTVVANGLRLEIDGGVTVAAEPLVISGNGGNFFGALQSKTGSNTWAGPITIAADATRIGAASGSALTVSGVIDSGVNAYNVTFRPADATALVTVSGANTYIGSTQIVGGTVAVLSLNSVVGGTASSSLGAPTTVANGTIALGIAGADGTLRYLGTGETTDRVVNLPGATNGGGLEQAGTGLLKFTSDFTATGVGSKTLTLSGSTAGLGEIAGSIPDSAPGNFTSVAKFGSGTWRLSGANTYTGLTTVNNGTLVVSGSLAGAATVSGPGAVLATGITGTITGTVSAGSGGTIAPGSVGAVGVLNSGSFSLNPGSAAVFDITSLSSYDRVNVTGSVSLGGGTLNVGGSLLANYGDLFFLIANDDVDAVFGTFDGLTEGSTFFAASGQEYKISYTADLAVSSSLNFGSAVGNDVALMAVPEPATSTVLLGGFGMLLGLRRRRR